MGAGEGQCCGVYIHTRCTCALRAHLDLFPFLQWVSHGILGFLCFRLRRVVLGVVWVGLAGKMHTHGEVWGVEAAEPACVNPSPPPWLKTPLVNQRGGGWVDTSLVQKGGWSDGRDMHKLQDVPCKSAPLGCQTHQNCKTSHAKPSFWTQQWRMSHAKSTLLRGPKGPSEEPPGGPFGGWLMGGPFGPPKARFPCTSARPMRWTKWSSRAGFRVPQKLV